MKNAEFSLADTPCSSYNEESKMDEGCTGTNSPQRSDFRSAVLHPLQSKTRFLPVSSRGSLLYRVTNRAWCFAQRIKISMIAGGNHTVMSAQWRNEKKHPSTHCLRRHPRRHYCLRGWRRGSPLASKKNMAVRLMARVAISARTASQMRQFTAFHATSITSIRP